MKSRISFTDIDVSSDGWIRCNVTRETTEQFHIQLPYSFTPSSDLIAAAFASLCGNTFDEIEIDLPIGPSQHGEMERALQTKVLHCPGLDIRHRAGSEKGLNFSGGFDSLAAKAILGDAHLISLDFGGRFSRERKFFERFSPMIFSTNLTDLKLNKHSWQFMGIGAILLRDELQLGSYSFGSIMAGSLPRLHSHPSDQSVSGIPFANALGMRLANPVAGVTEIGALQIAAMNYPEMLIDALMSVALPKEDKFQRKYQMVEATCSSIGLPIQMPNVPNRSARARWGASFATDLSSLYVIKTLGADYLSATYDGGIPDAAIDKLDEIDLSFMLRVNPHAYQGVNYGQVGEWYGRLADSQIIPYQRKDWCEVDKVMQLLRQE